MSEPLPSRASRRTRVRNSPGSSQPKRSKGSTAFSIGWSTSGPPAGNRPDVVRLLLLTGCRAGEILKLQWSEVDGDRLNLADTKTGPRRVWLSEAAQTVLARQPHAASPYVFPSPRHADKPLSHSLCLWRRARKEAGLDDVRLHDPQAYRCQPGRRPGAFPCPPLRGCSDTPTP